MSADGDAVVVLVAHHRDAADVVRRHDAAAEYVRAPLRGRGPQVPAVPVVPDVVAVRGARVQPLGLTLNGCRPVTFIAPGGRCRRARAGRHHRDRGDRHDQRSERDDRRRKLRRSLHRSSLRSTCRSGTRAASGTNVRSLWSDCEGPVNYGLCLRAGTRAVAARTANTTPATQINPTVRKPVSGPKWIAVAAPAPATQHSWKMVS